MNNGAFCLPWWLSGALIPSQGSTLTPSSPLLYIHLRYHHMGAEDFTPQFWGSQTVTVGARPQGGTWSFWGPGMTDLLCELRIENTAFEKTHQAHLWPSLLYVLFQ